MAKFCTNCGAPLSPDNLFCEDCGARIAPAQPRVEPDKRPGASDQRPGARRIQDNDSGMYTGTVSAFARTKNMTEAAGIAISRNPSGKWSYWDAPGSLNNNPRSLLRFSEKEDRRLSKTSDGEGIKFYTVSPAGSVGQVYEDEYQYDDHRLILEWVFFAPGESDRNLPQNPNEL